VALRITLVHAANDECHMTQCKCVSTDCCRPLHIAARYGLVSVVQQLIEKGADVYAMDNNGQFVFLLPYVNTSLFMFRYKSVKCVPYVFM